MAETENKSHEFWYTTVFPNSRQPLLKVGDKLEVVETKDDVLDLHYGNCFSAKLARISPASAAPVVDAEKQARDLVDAFRFASPPVQSLRFLEWEPLVMAIANALRTAAATAAPQQSEHKMLHYFTPSERGDTCVICQRGVLEHPETPKHNIAAAPVEQKTFKNTKEAMLYAQRNNIPAVVPVDSSARAAAEWSKEWPTEDGWYWMRGFRFNRPIPVEIEGDSLSVMFVAPYKRAKVEGLAEFRGPIAPDSA